MTRDTSNMLQNGIFQFPTQTRFDAYPLVGHKIQCMFISLL
jgi:hypothetical protein